MERRILFISLLPTVALAFALAAGDGDGDDASPLPGEMTRIGSTVVEPAQLPRDHAQVATLFDVAK